MKSILSICIVTVFVAAAFMAHADDSENAQSGSIEAASAPKSNDDSSQTAPTPDQASPDTSVFLQAPSSGK